MTAAATTEQTRPKLTPKLTLNKKRIVNVAALKQQKSTPVQQEAAERAAKKAAHEQRMQEEKAAAAAKKAAKQAAHEQLLKERAEAAARKREAEKKEANRRLAQQQEERATAHKIAVKALFESLPVINKRKPLAHGSFELLLEYAREKISPEISNKIVRDAVKYHTNNGHYLNTIATNAEQPRYNPVTGEINGFVTADEAAHATQQQATKKAMRTPEQIAKWQEERAEIRKRKERAAKQRRYRRNKTEKKRAAYLAAKLQTCEEQPKKKGSGYA